MNNLNYLSVYHPQDFKDLESVLMDPTWRPHQSLKLKDPKRKKRKKKK